MLVNFYINSTVNGTLFSDNGCCKIPIRVYMNSLLNANPTLSKLLVKVEIRPTVLLDATPNPYHNF
jgi:hypothetical protein